MKAITNLSIIIIVVTLGTVGIISSISYVEDANAVSCKNEPGPPCHGCSSFGPGSFHSNFQCRHLPQ